MTANIAQKENSEGINLLSSIRQPPEEELVRRSLGVVRFARALWLSSRKNMY